MKNLKELVLSAFLFLVIFSSIHMISDCVKVKLPFLASSEAVWEHMKMGIYAATITYAISWKLRRRGSFSGLSAFTLGSVFSMFTYYYSVVSITGPLGKISLGADLSVAIIATWLCGFTGAVIAFKVEELKGGAIKWVLIANYLCLILLSFTTTYIGPPMSLFKAIGR